MTQPQLVKGALIDSVALLRLSALGDVVLMVPMVRTLQHTFPELKITWVISRPMHALLEGMGGVEFIVIDKPKRVSDYLKLRKQFKAYKFDVLLAAQANLRVNLIYPWIKATCKLGFDNERSREGHRYFVDHQIRFQPNHLLDSFMQFAFAMGATKPQIRWDLPIGESDWAWAKQQLGDGEYIAINPLASKSDRNWSIERNVALIKAIREKWPSKSIVLTGGPSDEEIKVAAAIEQQAGDCLNLVGQSSLKQLAALLGSVKCLVSPDTGPAHLAVAMATPVVGLYADITSKLSGPYLSQDLVVDRYEQALEKYCHKDAKKVPWITRVHNAEAMNLITVDDVVSKLSTLFEEE
ncbi:MAG: glycosyltransferase family 9 protein [Coxiellaceae bacterium]|nr:glycosyltransferase family 9 protein [Coxiellaceae bacterium]